MNHPMQFVSTHPFLYYKSRGFIRKDYNLSLKHPPIIEDDVWISSGAIILPGVRIGKGAIIAAGAVVTKDVEEYSVVAGVPAKKIKMRFDKKIIQELEKINWTEWDEKKIKDNIDLFYNPRDFIKKFGDKNEK